MREIERRRKRRNWIAGGSLAFAILAVVLVIVPRLSENRGGEGAASPLRTARTVRIVSRPLAPVLSSTVAPPPPQSARIAETSPKKHRHHRKDPVAIASAEPITIELQTANPDIRIIWIAK